MDDGGGKMPAVESDRGSEEASFEESSLKAQGTVGTSEGRTCYQCRKSKVSAATVDHLLSLLSLNNASWSKGCIHSLTGEYLAYRLNAIASNLVRGKHA